MSIITPYREQKSLLAREFMKRFGREVLQCVQISTIDGAQAQEADIVIMSCVRANNARSVGFLADQRRLNVGLTRAKHSMFILGHSRSLSGNECWLQLIKDAKARGVYRNVCECECVHVRHGREAD